MTKNYKILTSYVKDISSKINEKLIFLLKEISIKNPMRLLQIREELTKEQQQLIQLQTSTRIKAFGFYKVEKLQT